MHSAFIATSTSHKHVHLVQAVALRCNLAIMVRIHSGPAGTTQNIVTAHRDKLMQIVPSSLNE